MLIFRVQGSSKNPYKVTAEGAGSNFVMYCTCPAGRSGRAFCKHRRGLLYGDISNVVEGAALVIELREMARGSEQMVEASSRPLDPQKHIPPANVVCIKTLAEHGSAQFEDSGYAVEFLEGEEPWSWQAVNIFEHFKNGKRRKQPAYSLTWDLSTGDDVVQLDGTIAVGNIKPRSRPFSVRGKRGKSFTTRARFPDAYDALITYMLR